MESRQILISSSNYDAGGDEVVVRAVHLLLGVFVSCLEILIHILPCVSISYDVLQ